MEKIKPILSLVFKILFVLVVTATSMLSLATGYIMFAPDSFPKPFHLVYQYPGEAPYVIQPASGGENTSSSGGEPAQTTDTSHGSTGTTTRPTTPRTTVGGIVPGQGIMFDTGAKIINLADEGGRKYIRINVVLEFAPNDLEAYNAYLAKQKGSQTKEMVVPSEGAPGPDYVTTFTNELNSKKPVIDDVITQVISSHTFEELYTSDGKEALKKEIIEQVNARLPEYLVIAVYFSEFVVE